MDRLRLLSPHGKSSNQPKLQLTSRLDELQNELNKKNEESITLIDKLTDISENMEKKTEENKDLLLKLFSLEEKNMNLEQELSVYRVSQCDVNKENKSVNKLITPKSIATCGSEFISPEKKWK